MQHSHPCWGSLPARFDCLGLLLVSGRPLGQPNPTQGTRTDAFKLLQESALTAGVLVLPIAAFMAMVWAPACQAPARAIRRALPSLIQSKFLILLLIHVVLLQVATFMGMTAAALILTAIPFLMVSQPKVESVYFGIPLLLNLGGDLRTFSVGACSSWSADLQRPPSRRFRPLLFFLCGPDGRLAAGSLLAGGEPLATPAQRPSQTSPPDFGETRPLEL